MTPFQNDVAEAFLVAFVFVFCTLGIYASDVLFSQPYFDFFRPVQRGTVKMVSQRPQNDVGLAFFVAFVVVYVLCDVLFR